MNENVEFQVHVDDKLSSKKKANTMKTLLTSINRVFQTQLSSHDQTPNEYSL